MIEFDIRPSGHLVPDAERGAQDREWVPSGAGNSLYLRPFMIATQPGLGVNHPSNQYLFCVIASPAASYFSGGANGIKPVTVWLSQDYTRAAPGGTGGVKTGGSEEHTSELQSPCNLVCRLL